MAGSGEARHLRMCRRRAPVGRDGECEMADHLAVPGHLVDVDHVAGTFLVRRRPPVLDGAHGLQGPCMPLEGRVAFGRGDGDFRPVTENPDAHTTPAVVDVRQHLWPEVPENRGGGLLGPLAIGQPAEIRRDDQERCPRVISSRDLRHEDGRGMVGLLAEDGADGVALHPPPPVPAGVCEAI